MIDEPNTQTNHRGVPRTMLLAIALFVPFGMGVRQCEQVVIDHSCNPDSGTDKYCGCEYDGKHYDSGQGFKSSDGCNECSCQPDGTVICTLRACIPPPMACGQLSGQTCADGQYCDLGPTCGAADGPATCKSIPEVCNDIYAPVCACGGETFPNACEAARAQATVEREGECGGGQSGGCDYEGQHYNVGEGYPAADGCNKCSCQKDGSTVCTEIACLQRCGGRIMEPCASGQYCEFSVQAICGRADATGVCSPKPDACTFISKPVCGCDEKSYGNACEAAHAGQSVLSEGECGGSTTMGCDYNGKHYNDGDAFPSTDGCNTCMCDGAQGIVGCTKKACVNEICGGLTGAQCPTGKYCHFAPDAFCGAADQTGMCEAIPTACDKQYKPVCGCDDKTYGNACEAASKGISARDGECGTAAGGCDYNGKHYQVGESFPDADGCNSCSCSKDGQVACTLRACAPDKICGGFAGLTCESKTQYCKYPEGGDCGFADGSGVCTAKPEICTAIFAPVCGCDGKTYSSDCNAAAAGMSVKSQGGCP